MTGRQVTGVDVGWLLGPAGPAHRLLPRSTRAACGVSLVDALPATRLACQVYRIDLCRACWWEPRLPVHRRQP